MGPAPQIHTNRNTNACKCIGLFYKKTKNKKPKRVTETAWLNQFGEAVTPGFLHVDARQMSATWTVQIRPADARQVAMSSTSKKRKQIPIINSSLLIFFSVKLFLNGLGWDGMATDS